jgi:superfamily II DNA/RNA helicase
LSDTTNPTTDNPHFGVNDLEANPDKAFRDYELDDRLVDALEADGKTHPFPIQALTLPMALNGHDIIGQARTGTGKTLAFGLPLLNALDPELAETQALIVLPTRELCLQVHEELKIGNVLGITTQAVYGGVGYDEQTEALTGGVHVVVGTPGRLLDMLNRKILDLTRCRVLVLDEADEMLDMGFLPDVERLIQAAGTDVEHRHTMLFSATMPGSVVKLGRRYMDKPTFMRADTEDHETAPTVDQHFFQVYRMDKPRVLARILQQPERGNVYVFCRTKAMVDRLVRELEDLSVKSIAIHGDIRQAAREKNMDTFRDGDVSVLVATEVAARGLDVDNVTHVVNYDCPEDEKMYLHRIGRTARAGAKGVAVTFAEHSELARASMIRKAVDPDDEIEVEEIFSTSDRLTELFDLPDETPWAHLAKSGSSRSSSSKSSSSKSGSSRGGGSKSSGSSSSRGGSGRSGSARDEGSGSRSSGRSSQDDGGSRRGSRRGSGGGTSTSDAGSSSEDRGGRGSRGDAVRDRAAATREDAPTRDRDDASRTSGRSSRDDSAEPRTSSRRKEAASPTDDRDREVVHATSEVDDLVAERAKARRERSRSRRDDNGGGNSGGSERTGRRERSHDDGGRSRSSDDAAKSTGGEQPRGGARPRSRRRRSSGSSDTGGGDRSSDGGAGGGAAGGRTSTGRSGDGASGRQRSGDGRRGGRGSSRSDGGRGRGGGNQQGSSGDDAQSRANDERGADKGGKSGAGGDRNQRGGRSQRSSNHGGGRNQRGGKSQRGNNQRGGNQRSNQRGGNDQHGGGREQAVPGMVTTAAGPVARGDGQPRLARRVAVEHLP